MGIYSCGLFCDGDEASTIVLARDGIRRPLIRARFAERISSLRVANAATPRNSSCEVVDTVFQKGCDRMGHKDDVRMDKILLVKVWKNKL